jgi:hypothetical protein
MVYPSQMALLEECQKLEKTISKRKDELASLAKKLSWGDMKKNRPKRYSVDLEFDPGSNIPESGLFPGGGDALRAARLEFLQPQLESFVVDAGTYFYCNKVESSVRFTGNVRVTDFSDQFLPSTFIEGQPGTVTLGWGNSGSAAAASSANFRNDMFDFNWEIRDTGSDREWQNIPQPDVFLCSGRLSGARLPIFGRVKGGSEVEVRVSPFVNRPSEGVFFSELVQGTTTSKIRKIVVQISFHGYERIL